MPDTRTHRGRHPEDARLFAPEAQPRLRAAVSDLSWLLSRDYAQLSAVKIVGDRYNLTQRQRMAITRASCSDQALARRQRSEIPPDALRGQTLILDGYNVLTTIEAALAGGVILACRDGTFRDIASIHGTWRRVSETIPALELIGAAAAELGVSRCRWLLDSPVSNSGRLKAAILKLAQSRGWNWEADLVPNPDSVLIASDQTEATADSVILDRCGRWFNLARWIVTAKVSGPLFVDLKV
jgi:hypothetical protein